MNFNMSASKVLLDVKTLNSMLQSIFSFYHEEDYL